MKAYRHTYLLVDGYNMINSWPELIQMMDNGLDSARELLLDYMSEYAKVTGERVTVVFDAYQVKGSIRVMEESKGIEVVYTKEEETADHFIEGWLSGASKRDLVKVATSDGMIQNIILGKGGVRMTALELRNDFFRLKSDINRASSKLKKRHKSQNIVSFQGKSLEALEEALRNIKEN